MPSRDLLLEVGTEELPPKSLPKLSKSLAEAMTQLLTEHRFDFDSVDRFATPRRLALRINGLSEQQRDSEIERRGPALKAAWDENGEPTKALLGFAKGNGIKDLSALETLETDKGAWVVYRALETGKPLSALIEDLINKALAQLPVERRMRWGSSRAEFVRPVHWVTLLFGDEVLPAEILGKETGNTTRGHRFMSTQATSIVTTPSDYEDILEKQFVIASFEKRRQLIAQQVSDVAVAAGGQLAEDNALLDEVTALVEWPVALSGSFDPSFLEVPDEALISAMREHQRYFHLTDDNNQLLPIFITVANLASNKPNTIVEGNERVIRPRLSDAAFFFRKDSETPVETRLERMSDVLFQAKLGSFRDKAERISQLATFLAGQVGADADICSKAGLLCKTDLVSDMVGEFPDLQGIMGGYYARADGESDAVATAITEHYLPAFAGGPLPSSKEACCVAIADKMDTLVGIFGIGEPPSGSRDPFALRRQTLGIIRICIEQAMSLNLSEALQQAARLHNKGFETAELHSYFLDRLEGWYTDSGINADAVKSVRFSQAGIFDLYEADQRIKSVEAFKAHVAAGDLAAANKRIFNILKKSGDEAASQVNPALFTQSAETQLHQRMNEVAKSQSGQAYSEQLETLATMQPEIEAYFDDVMVMADDETVRKNRLALLSDMKNLFVQVADLSQLSL